MNQNEKSTMKRKMRCSPLAPRRMLLILATSATWAKMTSSSSSSSSSILSFVGNRAASFSTKLTPLSSSTSTSRRRRAKGKSVGLSMYLSPEDGSNSPPPPFSSNGSSSSSSSNNNNNNNSGGGGGGGEIRRLDVRGVSVSRAGFLLLLSASYDPTAAALSGGKGVAKAGSSPPQPRAVAVPVRITPPSAGDAYAATSPEALTIIQLLSGVDMAGAVLPPQALQELVALYCTYDESDDDDDDDDDDEREDEDGIILIEDELGLAWGGGAEGGGWTSEEDRAAADNARQEDAVSVVKSLVSKSLPDDVPYEEANQWLRVRVRHPKMSLDGVTVGLAPGRAAAAVSRSTSAREKDGEDEKVEKEKEKEEEGGMGWDGIRPTPLVYTLHVTVENTFRLDVPLYSEVGTDIGSYGPDVRRSKSALEGSAYAYDPDTSAAFTSIALALRYKVPVVVEALAVEALAEKQLRSDAAMAEGGRGVGDLHCVLSPSCAGSDVDRVISDALPQWRGASALRDTSDRVVRTVERGFEAHKLRAALRIALEKGDRGAEGRIRAELAKFENEEAWSASAVGGVDFGGRGEVGEDLVNDDEDDDEEADGGDGGGPLSGGPCEI